MTGRRVRNTAPRVKYCDAPQASVVLNNVARLNTTPVYHLNPRDATARRERYASTKNAPSTRTIYEWYADWKASGT